MRRNMIRIWIFIVFMYTISSSSVGYLPNIFNAPICRYHTLPCVQLIDRNISEIVLPSDVKLSTQYASYSPMYTDDSCPTNYSACVSTNVYTPILSALSSKILNLTISILDSDIIDTTDRYLSFNLSNSIFLDGPPCLNSCNKQNWTTQIQGITYGFNIANATGIMDIYLVSKLSRFKLSSISLEGQSILPISNKIFSPTISLENDPTRLRLSFFLPRGITNSSICISLPSALCPVDNSISFQSLHPNTSISILQGISSLRPNLTLVGKTSFCIDLQWEPFDPSTMYQPVGIALSGVTLSNTTKIPLFIQWTARDTSPQCSPLVILSSPQSIAKNFLEPKTLWTVISLVIYVFAFLIACILIRLNGLTFIRETMYTDLALICIFLLLLSSILIHILWLNILNQLPGNIIENGFLVAILDSIRQCIEWTFLTSICIHWLSIVSSFFYLNHGKLFFCWFLIILLFLILLLFFIFENYNIIKCIYVDYLRNNNNNNNYYLPFLQPYELKYGINKVCNINKNNFLYYYNLIHILFLLLNGIFFLIGFKLIFNNLHILKLIIFIFFLFFIYFIQHFCMLIFYSYDIYIKSILFLLFGEFFPILIPSIGFLLLQWNSKIEIDPIPSISTLRWKKSWMEEDLEEAEPFLSNSMALIPHLADLTLTIDSNGLIDGSMTVEIYQSMEETENWLILDTFPYKKQEILKKIIIKYEKISKLRFKIIDGSILTMDFLISMEELFQCIKCIEIKKDFKILIELNSTIKKKLKIENKIEMIENLNENKWPINIVLEYLKYISIERNELLNQAKNDMKKFQLNKNKKKNYKNIIDQIQDESEIEIVHQWLYQRIQKREEYNELLLKCIELYKERRCQGIFLKLSTEKKNNLLRFLPINFHFHDIEIENYFYTTITQGAFASHTTSKIYSNSIPTTILNNNNFMDETFRYQDELKWSNLIRQDECNSHGLTSLVSSVIHEIEINIKLNNLKIKWNEWKKLNFLFQVESLLSDHGKESYMLQDCMGTMEWLGMITFGLEFIDIKNCNHQSFGVLRIELIRNELNHGFHVKIYLCCSHIFNAEIISVTPILFTQGINEMQTLANKATMYKETIPEQINEASYESLLNYINQQDTWPLINEIQLKLNQLKKSILQGKRERVKKKHPEILQYAAQITRMVQGSRVTCCKNGNNRTAMSVTLEYGWILGHFHYLSPSGVRRAISKLRSDGVSLDCVEKNIGKRQYSFNALQRSMLPEAYRCPEGTYGNGNTS